MHHALMQLAASKGWLHAGGHAAFGLLLLGNVTFNYAQCVRTPPGTPEDLPHEVHEPASRSQTGHSPLEASRSACAVHNRHLEKITLCAKRSHGMASSAAQCLDASHDQPPMQVLAAVAEDGRYCHTCGWPKPELAHHCHICNK
jgi:hypothetical protein